MTTPSNDDVVAEVRAAFKAYEADLLANDVDALDRWFLDGQAGQAVIRFIFGAVELGADAVSRARRAVPRQTAPRTVEQLEIRAWGRDVASAFAVCRSEDGAVVHQSQTWVRVDGAWRVAAAHVSRA